MKCINCNQEIGNSNKFCPNCGAPVNVMPQQPAPQAPQAQPAPQSPSEQTIPQQPAQRPVQQPAPQVQQPQAAPAPQQPVQQPVQQPAPQVPQQPQAAPAPQQPVQQPVQQPAPQAPQQRPMPQAPQRPPMAQMPQQYPQQQYPQAAQQPQQPQYAAAPKKSNKGLFIGLGIAAAIAIIAGACWFFLRGGGNSDLEKMIPKSASAVVRIDAKQLAEKIGMEINGSDINLPKRVLDLAGSDGDDIYESFSKIKDSGINPLGDIYAFTTNEALTGAILIPLFDQKKAKEFLEKETHETFSTVDNGFYTSDGNSIVMIKNDVLLIGGSKDRGDSEALKNLASDLMDGKKDNITSNGDITSKLHNDKAISLYVNNEQISSLLNDVPGYRSTMRDNPLSFLLDDISSTSMTLDVDDNVVTLASDLTTKGKDYENFMETVFHPAGNDFLKFMPAGCNIMAAAGVNGKKITSMQQISSLLQAMPPQVKSIIESLNGTIAAGATFNPNHPGNMAYTILIGSDNPNALLSFIKESMYSPSMGNIGVAGNYVYISTASQVAEGSFSAPSECKDVFKDNWLAAYSTLSVSNFDFNVNLGINSAKKTKGSLYINENGKKMKPIEWPVAFAKAGETFDHGF